MAEEHWDLESATPLRFLLHLDVVDLNLWECLQRLELPSATSLLPSFPLNTLGLTVGMTAKSYFLQIFLVETYEFLPWLRWQVSWHNRDPMSWKCIGFSMYHPKCAAKLYNWHRDLWVESQRF